jgi:hypothetical protein
MELAKAGEDLTKTKPKKLIIGDDNIYLNSWAEVCVEVVEWLYKNKLFDVTDCPVNDCHDGRKYFVNTEEKHKISHRGGIWKTVGPFKVDVKYKTKDQINNILVLLRHLGVTDPGIRIEAW